MQVEECEEREGNDPWIEPSVTNNIIYSEEGKTALQKKLTSNGQKWMRKTKKM